MITPLAEPPLPLLTSAVSTKSVEMIGRVVAAFSPPVEDSLAACATRFDDTNGFRSVLSADAALAARRLALAIPAIMTFSFCSPLG